MNTPMELAKDYIFTHVLRQASAGTYLSATRALLRHFGEDCTVESINHRSILEWRRKELDRGLAKQSWNTYSNHLRTVWGYAIEQGTLLHSSINPFRKTAVIPPRRPSKTIVRDGIRHAREWLKTLVAEERRTGRRSRITPAWFWLAVFEMFYYTGVRLNALLSIRVKDVDWDSRMIMVEADTEKTHRQFSIPIMPGLEPHIRRLLDAAEALGFGSDDQLFNVNRFSRHYRSVIMNTDQVEGMYKKITQHLGIRMTPHRFRHTLATDLMRQPERNIHLTKSLLNHSNIATTLSYIEVDYEHMRSVLHDRSLTQGAITFERRVDESVSISPPPTPEPSLPPAAAMIALPEPVAVPAIVDQTPIQRGTTTMTVTGVVDSESKLLTHVESLNSERYSLEQALQPTGTGLSHELTWDGPGTWWEELGIPTASPEGEMSEHSLLLTLMVTRVGIKSYSW